MTTDLATSPLRRVDSDSLRRSPVDRVGGILRSLFPDLGAEPRVDRVLGLMFLVASSVLAFLRIPATRRDTLWAEDGQVFFQGALSHGFFDGLVSPYAGYLHLYPRLTAEIAAAFPVEAVPYVLGGLASLAIGMTSWAVWTCARGLLPSRWLRGLLALGVALVPPTGLESIGNVANSHFFLLFAAFWALIGMRAAKWAQVAPAALVVLAALSDPTALVLLPLAVGRLVCAPRWRERVVPIAYAVAIVVQLGVALFAERATGETASLRDIAFGYSFRVVSPALVGLDWTTGLVNLGGSRLIWAVAGGTAVTLLLALAFFARQRMIMLAAGLASVAYFVVSCLFAVSVQYPPAGAEATNLELAARYTIVPMLLLLTALLAAWQGVLLTVQARGRVLVAVVQALAVVPLLVYVVNDFRPAPDMTGTVADWATQVDDAQQECRTSPQDETVSVVIAPAVVPPWRVDFACAELTH
jgi:hypothetical protein